MHGYREPRSEAFDFKGKAIQIQFASITEISADVIVSSDDNHLSMGGGVSRAILEAAGDSIWQDSRQYVPARIGDVVVTSAGNLQASYIFHPMVIDLDEGIWPDISLIQKVTSRCLHEADHLKCSTIALPALGTGVGSLASESAARAMIDAIFDAIDQLQHIMTITIALNRQDTLLDFVKLSVEERIKSEYESKLRALQIEKERLVEEIRQKSPYRDLPFPIAVTRRMIDSHSSYHSKFTSGIECMESILKYCAVIMLSARLQSAPNSKQHFYSFFKQNASLGSWSQQLEEALKLTQPGCVPGLIEAIRSFYFGPSRGHFTAAIKLRNEMYGHGATLVDDAYREHYEGLEQRIDKVLALFQPISAFSLVRVVSANVLEDCYEYEILRIVGDNIIFSRDRLRCVDLRLARDSLYVVDKQGEYALRLPPFLVFENCPKCGVQEAFFLEKIADSNAIYHTYRANHRMETNKYLHYLRD